MMLFYWPSATPLKSSLIPKWIKEVKIGPFCVSRVASFVNKVLLSSSAVTELRGLQMDSTRGLLRSQGGVPS